LEKKHCRDKDKPGCHCYTLSRWVDEETLHAAMETNSDVAIYYMLSRWVDEETFQRWRHI